MLKAQDLHRAPIQNQQFGQYVKDICKMLDDEIMKAHQNGKKDLITSIPNTFNIAGHDNKTAEIKIYSDVLMSLKNRNFIVYIQSKDNKTWLKIIWDAKMSTEETEVRTNIIQEHSQKFLK